MYKEALSCPMSNFRGVQFGLKSVPMATFILLATNKICDEITQMVVELEVRGSNPAAGINIKNIHVQYWKRYLHRSLLANTSSANLLPKVSILLVA